MKEITVQPCAIISKFFHGEHDSHLFVYISCKIGCAEKVKNNPHICTDLRLKSIHMTQTVRMIYKAPLETVILSRLKHANTSAKSADGKVISFTAENEKMKLILNGRFFLM